MVVLWAKTCAIKNNKKSALGIRKETDPEVHAKKSKENIRSCLANIMQDKTTTKDRR
jgi:hypothetical protein